MTRFIIRRILSGLLVIWGVVTLLFLIFNLLGDPSKMILGQASDAETEAAIRKAYHLDEGLFVQYLYYLNDLSPIGFVDEEDGNAADQSYVPLIRSGSSALSLKVPYLRRSFQTNAQVGSMLAEALPGTLILAFAAILFASFIGIPLGVISALKKNHWGDRLITVVTLIGISAPSFFMAVIIVRIFAVGWGDVTGFNVTGYLFEERIFGEGSDIMWRNLVLPAVALGIRPLSIITQLTRSSMLEVLGSDYIRTARAKGLSQRTVLFKHALRNALNPVITSISGWLASLLAGAFFIEYIFDWQGLGKLTIDALNATDYPVILGAALFIGVIFVVINILVDILYSQLDPRVKLTA